MINQHSVSTPSIAKRQSGVVLAVSLIILLLLTLIGVTSSNVTGLEEKMTANTKDVNLAFQAAEAALRATETDLVTTKPAFVCSATDTIPKTLAEAYQNGQGVKGAYTSLKADGQINPDTGILIVPPTLGVSPTIPFYNSVDWVAKPNTDPNTNKYAIYNNAISGGKKLVGLFRAPEYIVEELAIAPAGGSSGNGSLEGGNIQDATAGSVHTFRITAHGWGSNGNSVATVQSIIKITYSSATKC